MADTDNFIKRVGQNTWECLKCNNYHTSKANLKRHIQTKHFKLKPYSCAFCQKKFGQKVELNKHVKRIHKSEKLFVIQKLYGRKREVNKSEILCPSCKSVVFRKKGNGLFRYHNSVSDFANKQSHGTQSREFARSRSPAKSGSKGEKTEAKKVPKKIGPRSKTMAKSVKKENDYIAEEADAISYDEVLQDDPNYTSDESTEDNDDPADPDWEL